MTQKINRDEGEYFPTESPYEQDQLIGAPHREEKANGINPLSTAEPNYTIFGDKLADENQYCSSLNSSKTLNKEGRPANISHRDRNVPKAPTKSSLGIFEPSVGWAIDEPSCAVRRANCHQARFDWPLKIGTFKEGYSSLTAWRPTSMKTWKISHTRESKFTRVDSPRKSHLWKLHNDQHISCTFSLVPKLNYAISNMRLWYKSAGLSYIKSPSPTHWFFRITEKFSRRFINVRGAIHSHGNATLYRRIKDMIKAVLFTVLEKQTINFLLGMESIHEHIFVIRPGDPKVTAWNWTRFPKKREGLLLAFSQRKVQKSE